LLLYCVRTHKHTHTHKTHTTSPGNRRFDNVFCIKRGGGGGGPSTRIRARARVRVCARIGINGLYAHTHRAVGPRRDGNGLRTPGASRRRAGSTMRRWWRWRRSRRMRRRWTWWRRRWRRAGAQQKRPRRAFRSRITDYWALMETAICRKRSETAARCPGDRAAPRKGVENFYKV